MLERTSPLASQLAAGGRDGADGSRPVQIKELRGWYLTQLAAFRGRECEFEQHLSRLLGLDSRPGAAAISSRGALLNTAPGQYWLVTTDRRLERALQMDLPPVDGSVTSLSHSRVRLAVIGPNVPALLAKGISVDLRPERFRVGDFVETGLHHTAILLHRTGEARYELYLLRTFAVSLWGWLVDAALPFGFDIGVEELRAASP